MEIRTGILAVVLLASLAHARAQPSVSVDADMPVSQARREVQAALGRMYRGEFNEGWRPMDGITTHALRDVRVRSDRLEFATSANVVTSTMWGTRETLPARVELRFRELGPVKVSEEQPRTPPGGWYAGPPDTATICTRKCGNFFWTDRAQAERFARALNVLIAAAQGRVRDGFAEFRAFAVRWRALERKPQLSEEADKHRLLAEHALQKNDLAGAADLYDDALEGFPGWPEGWMNAALLCEALKDYACAADRMRHYLELMPDSRESSAAREKLRLWEALARN